MQIKNASWKDDVRRKSTTSGHRQRPPAALHHRVVSTGQDGFINIDQHNLSVIVPKRVLLKSPDGATKTNVWRVLSEKTKTNWAGKEHHFLAVVA